MEKLFSAVMPSIAKDVNTILKNSEAFFKHLPINNICVIGPGELQETINNENNGRLVFINENEFVDVQKIRALYYSRTGKQDSHVGWYVQQFIKLNYSRFTNDEYYLIWDSDTIPVRDVTLSTRTPPHKPYFDLKTHYHAPYFNTIGKILPSTSKQVKGSFISEHMLIKSQYMQEMLNEIENNPGLIGENFCERIINAIDINDLIDSGFSEFETYGNYVMTRYPEAYALRKWHSLRSGMKLYSEIDERNEKWLAKYYDAVSIEKWQHDSKLASMIQSPLFQKLFPPQILQLFHKIEIAWNVLKSL